MYKQSIDHIKLAIIPLDGTVLDLNRYRYNYVRHYFENKKIEFGLDDFYPYLSNMYDMYKNIPLLQEVDIGPFNSKIERELFQYLSHKGVVPKKGFLELLEYLRQKEIKVAIISTHRSKDAQKYLELAHIASRVDYVIGSDTTSLPLPSTQILQNILDHFQMNGHETLVISSFMALNHAANALEMNVIYCDDLKKAGQEEKETSYKTVSDLFDALNILLFDRYNDANIYSTILGMDPQMSQSELDEVKQKLDQTYQNDPQIMDLVEQTYAYHISQLGNHSIKDASVLLQQPSRKRFAFDDEDHETEKKEKRSQEFIFEKDEEEKPKEVEKSVKKREENELTSLLEQISKNADEDVNDEPLLDDSSEEDSTGFIGVLINIVYVFAVSFIVLFAGILVYIAFIHQFQQGDGAFGVIGQIALGYIQFIEMVFQLFFDGLHDVISFIPSYEDYLSQNALFSMDGVCLLNIYIFQVILIAIIRLIIYYLRREDYD